MKNDVVHDWNEDVKVRNVQNMKMQKTEDSESVRREVNS